VYDEITKRALHPILGASNYMERQVIASCGLREG